MQYPRGDQCGMKRYNHFAAPHRSANVVEPFTRPGPDVAFCVANIRSAFRSILCPLLPHWLRMESDGSRGEVMRSVWVPWVRFVVIGVALGKMVSCSAGAGGDGKGDGSGSSNEPVPVRISPASVESADSGASSAWALFDRDTGVGWSPPSAPPDSPTQVRVALGRAARITHLKIFGASPYVLGVRTGNGTAIKGLEHVHLDALGAGWNALRLPDSTSADELVLELARTDGGDASAPAPIGEIELWGVDRPTPMLDANAVGALATSSS